MYESKLGTETNTEITKIAAPKTTSKPKPLREPSPRFEEKLLSLRKRENIWIINNITRQKISKVKIQDIKSS